MNASDAKHQEIAVNNSQNGSDHIDQKIAKRKSEDLHASSPRKKKAPEPPTAVLPGALPTDASIWDNAVLLVDKPQTWTSFDVCGKIRASLAPILKVKGRKIKVGHAGTLDPMATGLLIVCVGKGTKSIESFVAMEKEYSGIMKLGEVTDSYDAEGEVVEEVAWTHITNACLEEEKTAHFLGDIQQIPPMFSALKVGGKRLYEEARKGKEVERKPRDIHVQRFDLIRDDESSPEVEFWVTCSKGTYIRSLVHDLAKAVGSGAHLTKLRRETIGEYSVQHAWKMDELTKELKAQKQALHGSD